jgi:hypothetical protein
MPPIGAKELGDLWVPFVLGFFRKGEVFTVGLAFAGECSSEVVLSCHRFWSFRLV